MVKRRKTVGCDSNDEDVNVILTILHEDSAVKLKPVTTSVTPRHGVGPRTLHSEPVRILDITGGVAASMEQSKPTYAATYSHVRLQNHTVSKVK